LTIISYVVTDLVSKHCTTLASLRHNFRTLFQVKCLYSVVTGDVSCE